MFIFGGFLKGRFLYQNGYKNVPFFKGSKSTTPQHLVRATRPNIFQYPSSLKLPVAGISVVVDPFTSHRLHENVPST